ncbi:hypothetical protein R3P38DRAFT_2910159 [Favolaschia claudopus]|uniref:C2H2-type domain-containing protein n=1 Tax=Favolaschia claudopus TaxID=2862362 RepID=A0AAW0CCS4_9AGAR
MSMQPAFHVFQALPPPPRRCSVPLANSTPPVPSVTVPPPGPSLPMPMRLPTPPVPTVGSENSESYGAQCDICGLALRRHTDLPRHMLLHASNKESLMFRCPVEGCRHQTLQKSNLATHIRTHTRAKPHKCPEYWPNGVKCDFTTADPSSLHRHRKRKHGYAPRPKIIAARRRASIPQPEPEQEMEEEADNDMSESECESEDSFGYGGEGSKGVARVIVANYSVHSLMNEPSGGGGSGEDPVDDDGDRDGEGEPENESEPVLHSTPANFSSERTEPLPPPQPTPGARSSPFIPST